jgi:hypothetical protein
MNNFESVPPGNWTKVESLSQGEEVSVKMLFGDKMNGRYIGLNSDAIRLNIDGEERIYPRKDIAEIRLLNINDSNQNGVGIGMLVGGVPAIFAALLNADEADTNADSAAVVSGLIGAGIGGLVGYMVDNVHKGSELIYRAPEDEQMAHPAYQ